MNGDSAGAAGAPPADGLNMTLMTLVTRFVIAVSGFAGVGATEGGGMSTNELWLAIIGDTIFGEAAANVRASANTATGSADWRAAGGSDAVGAIRADGEMPGCTWSMGVELLSLAGFGFCPAVLGAVVGEAVAVGVGEAVAVGAGVGDAVAVGVGVASAVCVASGVPVVPIVPVFVWALTTTPPPTVFVVVLPGVVSWTGSAVCLSGSVGAGVFAGSVEICVLVFVVAVSVCPLVV